MPAGTLGAEYFQADRFHLNPKGASLFTKEVAHELRSSLAPGQ
jgi:lysophospholipase L1-like esterase